MLRALQLKRLIKPQPTPSQIAFLANWDGIGSPTAEIGSLEATAGSLSGTGRLVLPAGGGLYVGCLPTQASQQSSWLADIYFYGPNPPIILIDNSFSVCLYHGLARLPGGYSPLPTLDSGLHHVAISSDWAGGESQIHLDGALILTADVHVASPAGIYCYGSGVGSGSSYPCEYEATRVILGVYYPREPISLPSLPF